MLRFKIPAICAKCQKEIPGRFLVDAKSAKYYLSRGYQKRGNESEPTYCHECL